jgi:hypothetical protein
MDETSGGASQRNEVGRTAEHQSRSVAEVEPSEQAEEQCSDSAWCLRLAVRPLASRGWAFGLWALLSSWPSSAVPIAYASLLRSSRRP